MTVEYNKIVSKKKKIKTKIKRNKLIILILNLSLNLNIKIWNYFGVKKKMSLILNRRLYSVNLRN